MAVYITPDESIDSFNEESRLIRHKNVLVQQDDEIVIIQDNAVPRDTGTSWYASVFLVVNAALGAGLLNFPQAYYQAGGIVTGIVIQAVFMIFIVAALVILAYCSDKQNTNTLQDVLLSVCGRKWQMVASGCLVLYCFGTCLTFLIIVADQWEEFLLYINKDLYCITKPWYTSRAFMLSSTSIAFILPMCFSEKIDFLKYASVIGVIGIFYTCGLVMVKYFLPHPEPRAISTSPSSWEDVFLVVPAICFAYQCHVSVIPIYSCIRPRTLSNFNKTIAIAISLCVISYTVTAAFGYLMFGDDITSDVLLSFDPSPEVIVAVVLIGIKTYTTYPILLFCGRAAFESIWVRIRGLSEEHIITQARKRRIIMTIVWFSLNLILGVFVPNIGVVIAILGTFAAIFIFVFPGMCLICLVLNRAPKKLTVRNKLTIGTGCIFVVLGMFIVGVTISQAIIQDLGGIHADISRYTC